MIEVEQAGYPYVEGSHGIPFNKAVRGLADDKYLVGGSGSLLWYGVTDRSIDILDENDRDFHLCADLSKYGRLSFDLQTRVERNGSIIRHPDFFAAKFVDFAIRNFELTRGEIRLWRATWRARGSDNYTEFIDFYDQTKDVLTAAKSTWTGRVAYSHGFSIRDEVHVDWRRGEEKVIVEFQR